MHPKHRSNRQMPLPRTVWFHTVAPRPGIFSIHCYSVTAPLNFSSGTSQARDGRQTIRIHVSAFPYAIAYQNNSLDNLTTERLKREYPYRSNTRRG